MDWKDFPPLTQLRAFEAAARLQGFSQAARELNVTPAAVAQQVRALEERLGCELIYREGRGLKLIAAQPGKEALTAIEPVIDGAAGKLKGERLALCRGNRGGKGKPVKAPRK